jgi:hypothetical protein
VTGSNRLFDPVATALSAIENASRVPIDRDALGPLLATGQGHSSHLRALYGDVHLHTLLRLASAYGVDNPTLARSYMAARRTAGAANAELDEFAAQFGL